MVSKIMELEGKLNGNTDQSVLTTYRNGEGLFNNTSLDSLIGSDMDKEELRNDSLLGLMNPRL